MKRQLRYGTNVIYNREIYRINSVAITDSVKIISLKTNDTIIVKKKELIVTPHDKNDLIRYKKNYYLIKNIICGSDNVPIYELDYPNKFYEKNKLNNIQSNDEEIHTIPQFLQEKLLTFLKFVDRYNTTINYLNKKTSNEFKYLNYDECEKLMNELMIICKFNINQLSRIEYTLKKTQNPSFELDNITKNPFGFITQELQLITFDKAEKIANEFNLCIDFKVKCEKWSYCLFSEEKTFYIRNFIFSDKFKKFCESRNEQNHNTYLYFIENNVIINKIIKGKEYKTTQYLLNLERTMTDMTMDLFYDKEYDIPEEEIRDEINNFEKMRRLEKNNPQYCLETEQKESVIKSVKNKLSIITGYPGTGKTEIVCCITHVLNKLHKKHNTTNSINSLNDTTNQTNDNPFNNYCYNVSEIMRENDEENDQENDEENDEESNKYVDPKTIGLLAPTGLAGLNLQKSINSKYYNDKISGTCHKILYNVFNKIKSHKNIQFCNCIEKEKCKYKNIRIKTAIIDEASMLDTFLFYEILQMCEYFNSRLIIIGDINQLPSVGAGTVLKNLINCNCFHVTKLINIKRQNAGSLVNTIKKMNKDIIKETEFEDDSMSVLNIRDFIVKDKEEINKDLLLKLIRENNIDQHNSKFITYFKSNKYLFNTVKINNILQDIFNPDGSIIPSNSKFDNEFVFKIDDKIIRTENDYSSEKMRANGEQAKITDFDGKLLTIIYDDGHNKSETIGINELHENFKLNYCTTIHSAQGSQYDNVIFFIQPGQSYIIDKTSVYTGISRAKNKCIVLSKKDDFVKCQENNKNNDNKVSLFMYESNKYELE